MQISPAHAPDRQPINQTRNQMGHCAIREELRTDKYDYVPVRACLKASSLGFLFLGIMCRTYFIGEAIPTRCRKSTPRG